MSEITLTEKHLFYGVFITFLLFSDLFRVSQKGGPWPHTLDESGQKGSEKRSKEALFVTFSSFLLFLRSLRSGSQSSPEWPKPQNLLKMVEKRQKEAERHFLDPILASAQK